MKRDQDRIVRNQRLHQPVAARQVVALGDEGAEQAVEHDQHAAVVAVEILGVDGMVHAMMRRRVEHIFQPAELRDPLGVQPELVEQVSDSAANTAPGAKPSQIIGT